MNSNFKNSSKIMCSFMLISTVIVIGILSKSYGNSEYIVSSSASPSSTLGVQNDLQEMLNTERVLIDNLRHFIETQEQKLNFLKRKTLEIQNIHDGATDREKYLYNPINAITIIKRFTADWKDLTNYADQYLNTEDFTKNYTQQLQPLAFPTDDDYDTALANLLRIQDMYKLEPQHLSVGKVNGVKLGSEMSWSDCLEIGLKSSKNGYHTYAKYWIETALEKLPITNSNRKEYLKVATGVKTSPPPPPPPPAPSASASSSFSTDDYTVKARIEILKALLNIEYKMGNLKKALKIVNEILQIQPKNKIAKAKKQIEEELKMNNGNNSNSNNNNTNNDDAKKQKLKYKKTDEELMIEEICREASNTQMDKQLHTASFNPNSSIPECTVVTNNLPSLLLQPLQVELLSLDPYIVIYHNAISDTQVKDLKDFIVEQDDMLEFTKIGQKKMRQINGKLHYVIGHHGQDLYDEWQVDRYNFENLMELQQMQTSATNEIASQAKILFNLQQPLIGGSIIFPQLDLGINLPMGSLLYWSTLNELNIDDYRSKYRICPVIGGTQLTVSTSIKNL